MNCDYFAEFWSFFIKYVSNVVICYVIVANISICFTLYVIAIDNDYVLRAVNTCIEIFFTAVSELSFKHSR